MALLKCDNCGGNVSSDAAHKVGDRIVCPRCVEPVKQELLRKREAQREEKRQKTAAGREHAVRRKEKRGEEKRRENEGKRGIPQSYQASPQSGGQAPSAPMSKRGKLLIGIAAAAVVVLAAAGYGINATIQSKKLTAKAEAEKMAALAEADRKTKEAEEKAARALAEAESIKRQQEEERRAKVEAERMATDRKVKETEEKAARVRAEAERTMRQQEKERRAKAEAEAAAREKYIKSAEEWEAKLKPHLKLYNLFFKQERELQHKSELFAIRLGQSTRSHKESRKSAKKEEAAIIDYAARAIEFYHKAGEHESVKELLRKIEHVKWFKESGDRVLELKQKYR